MKIHKDVDIHEGNAAAGSKQPKNSAKSVQTSKGPRRTPSCRDSESDGSSRAASKDKEDVKLIAKQLEGIIANCTVEEVRGAAHLRTINQDMRAQRIFDQEFDRVQVQMKDIESTQPALMQKVFNYREITQLQQDRESKEVTKEFRKSRMDTGRPEIGWERAINIKKRQNVIKEIKMVNKGKGSDLT